MTVDLVAFLEDALDEDEQVAKAAMTEPFPARQEAPTPGSWTTNDSPEVSGDDMWISDEGGHSEAHAAHIARWDPARVLAEVAAKRELLAIHGGVHRCPNHLMHEEELCRTLIALVGPYRDRAGFDPSWLD